MPTIPRTRGGARLLIRLLPSVICTMALCTMLSAQPALDRDALAWLGDRIFENECAAQISCLTSWNAGEEFPSLGIGHFIWYSAGQQAPFTETFPELLAFMAAQGAMPPAWLAEVGNRQPWADRQSFLDARDGARLRELRDFLAANKALQVAFIVERFDHVLGRLLAATAPVEHARIERRFHAVANAAQPQGLYALIDYVHFKGEGTSAAERYQDRGWGLLQVLEGMADDDAPLPAFVASARRVLAMRVALAPAERGEERWLAGWHNRLDTYLPPGATRATDTGASP